MTAGFVSIVGNGLRHRWLVAQLAADSRLELRGIVCEEKRARPTGASKQEDETIAKHFAERDDAEQRFFGEAPELEDLGAPVLRVTHGTSNEPDVAEWVRERRADRLQLFGCSIIREPLLDTYAQETINIHLGLSPYYRGAATNFWPLVNGEPECVGATIHVATLEGGRGADPEAAPARRRRGRRRARHRLQGDRRGAGASADAIAGHAAGKLCQGEPQKPGGHLYKNADFHAGAVEEMWRRLGMAWSPTTWQSASRRATPPTRSSNEAARGQLPLLNRGARRARAGDLPDLGGGVPRPARRARQALQFVGRDQLVAACAGTRSCRAGRA